MNASHAVRAAVVGCALLLGAAACGPAAERRPEPAAKTPPPREPATASADSLVRLATPVPGDTVSSPLLLRGEARGTWYFEASFPVRLLDADGREIAVTYATAQGEWMTTEFVPFTSTVTFASPPAGTAGTLVLVKDNPSGESKFDDERRIPVVFAGSP
jgi:hypothetical protein